ncbi:ANTAR domain-containing protein [Streptomyces sp. NK08204]|uniref:ANTAR domain-containing protein n=1 Tax=Streptomyces sp. NK08204 TaxID=2873260 RepID=UPI001CEDD57C|nr:ANTAR domain-containing protein [Streptomyces sp. NK08204]
MAFFTISKQRPLHLLSAFDLARENELLHEEIEQLKRAVASHAVIDQAIGVLVAIGRIAPEEAWRALRDVSQRTNTRLRTVAEHVLDFAQGGALPEPEMLELERAFQRYRKCSHPTD